MSPPSKSVLLADHHLGPPGRVVTEEVPWECAGDDARRSARFALGTGITARVGLSVLVALLLAIPQPGGVEPVQTGPV